MKKLLAGMLCAGMFFATACGSSASASEGGEAGVGMPNPMVEFTEPDFMEKAGFAVVGYPQQYALDSVWLINDTVAQLDFTVEENVKPIFRVAVDTGEDISGDYTVYDQTSEKTIEGTAVTLKQNTSGQTLATWSKDGYVFSLFFLGVGTYDTDGVWDIVRSFVTEVVMEPVPAA